MPAKKSVPTDVTLLNRFWSEEVIRTVLPNGLTVIVKPDRKAAVASVQVWVKTGSIHEDAELGAGLSHYLEHMLFKGTSRRNGRQISVEVQAHGGYINAYTTFDRTVYYIDLPAEHAAVAVDVLADMVLHSTLPADEVKKEKDVILREIAMGDDDPDQRLGQALFSTAFRQHPYAYPIIGHSEVFRKVERADLQAYYQARYVPNNMVVVVAGDVDAAGITEAITKHFGAASRSALAPVYIPPEPTQLAPRSLHQSAAVELSRAGLAWQIPGLTHPDAPALDVLAMILGSGDSSVLWQTIREKKRLVHAIDATSWNPGSNGLFYISFTADADKREAAAAEVLQQLERGKRLGFSAAQVRKAIRQLVVAEINTRKTMSGQASRLGVAEVVVGDLDFSRTYFSRLARLTPREVQRVLQHYLVPETCSQVSLNPTTAAPKMASDTNSAKQSAEFKEIKLRNGVRLLLQPDASLPNVHLRLCALGGPRYEPRDRRGATSLLATMMTKDAGRNSAAVVAAKIEEVGGSFYPMSGNNTFGVALEVLPPDLDRALGLLADAVLRPAFRQQTLDIEREAQLAVLHEDNDNVVAYGLKQLRKRFFGEHALAVGPHGEEHSLAAISAADLRTLRDSLLRGENVVLVAAGDFDAAKLEAACRKWLEQLPPGKPESVGPTFVGPGEPAEVVEKQPRQQAVVFEAYPGPAMPDEDFFVGEVLDELFSGMSSRLFERVRDELGLAYYVRSSRIIGLDAGMFYFYAGTAPGSEQPVLKEITAEIRRVKIGKVAPDELARCQTRLKAAHRMGQQTNSARALQAALNALYGRPVNDRQDYERRIDAVSVADLQHFVRKYFDRKQRVRLTVRP